MNSLWLDWDRRFNFEGLIKLHDDGFSGPALVFDLRLDLMKMPELALKGIDRLNLDFYIGVGFEDRGGGVRRWAPNRLIVALRALGFDKLNFDLMRFLELRADSVKFESVKNTSGASVAALGLRNVSVRILGKSIVEKLTAYIFSGSGPAAFAVFSGKPVNAGPIAVRWILIGHNVTITRDLAIKLMELGFSNQAQDKAIADEIEEKNVNKLFIDNQPAANQGRWIFAAAFSFAGLFDGKFLFQDQVYYGIALGGGVFKEWFGYDVAVSVLYMKGREPAQDAFRVSIRVPRITLPAFQFMGGELAIQIAMNGGFILDAGFPHLTPLGARKWDRALGAIVTPFQGSGGFYIQKYSVYLPAGNTGLLISAGYAVQVGLGGSFGGGVFTAWVTAGFFFVLEGSVYFAEGKLNALRLVGAVGVVVRGGAQLNFWIITATLEITLSAEARAAISWRQMPEEYARIGGSDAPVGTDIVRLDLDITLYASASAEACIGKGWFRICKGIDVSIPIRYQFSLELG